MRTSEKGGGGGRGDWWKEIGCPPLVYRRLKQQVAVGRGGQGGEVVIGIVICL